MAETQASSAGKSKKEGWQMIICPSFPDHWKTRVLRSLAGDAGVLCLLRLWGHCQNRKSQKFDGSPAIVSAIAIWDGDPVTLENALIESRFATRDGNTFTMHEWEHHNAKLMTASERGKLGGRPRKQEQEKKPEKPQKKNGFQLQKPVKNMTV